jgi:hypothetical protein
MKLYSLSIILLALTLCTPARCFSADKANSNKTLSEKFYLEIYENDIKQQDRLLYVDLTILNKKEVQWTTVFLDSSRCVKKDTHVPMVSRWDEGISDVEYDSKSFKMKLRFPFADEEVLVRGHRMPNGEFRVEGAGFRKDLSSKNLKVEWKSIHD